MASSVPLSVDEQVRGETQEARRVTIVLTDEIHVIPSASAAYDSFSSKRRTTLFSGFARPSKCGFASVARFHFLSRVLQWLRCRQFASSTASSTASHTRRLQACYAKLLEKCALRTLLLVYVCLNEVLRYHYKDGSASVVGRVSEGLLVLLLLLEFVYDSISMGLWRGSVRYFHSRRCVYNFIVLLAAFVCAILEVLWKVKPSWYTAQVALVAALGRFIRLFRVYQTRSFQTVHSIFKKSSFNLIALAGLSFLFALFYVIIFFHIYGYTQFNLCYKDPTIDSTQSQGKSDISSSAYGMTGCQTAGCSSGDKMNARKSAVHALQSFNSDSLRSSLRDVSSERAIRLADQRAPEKDKKKFCDATSTYWEFDTTQQHLCTPGRACNSGTTCRNVFFDVPAAGCSVVELQRLQRAAWDIIFENRVSDFGTTGFHSGISALTSLLECMTLEGWSALMYRQADGDATTRGVAAFFIFLSVVILGNLLLMNLVVAVVWENTILESSSSKEVGARDEDLQLFEILGMEWVRHLLQQLSRHDIFKSEETMLAYQCAKHEARRSGMRVRTSGRTSSSGLSLVGNPAAAETIEGHVADSACSAIAPSCTTNLGHASFTNSSSPSSLFTIPLPASSRAVCDTPNGAAIVCTPHSSSTRPAPSLDPLTADRGSFETSPQLGSTLLVLHSNGTSLRASSTKGPASSLLPGNWNAAPVTTSFVHRHLPHWRTRVLYAVSRKQYVALMFFIVLIDLCCTMIFAPAEQAFQKLLVDCVFVTVYVIDICLQLIGFGWRQYFQDGFKIFDLAIALMELLGLLIHFSLCGFTVSTCLRERIYPSGFVAFNVYMFFRSFHAVRIFKVVRSFAALRILVELMHDLLRSVFFIYALVLFEVFIFCLVGVICFGDSHYEERAAEVTFAAITRFFNFSNIWKSFMLVYGLMTGESWNVVISELFGVYVNYQYKPSEHETLLPSHLFLKTSRPAYIITAYVSIAVLILCCFIFNVFGAILIGQYVTSRRLVYNRHVFKLLKLCREVGIEMPSPEAVGSANLQRMYSLAQPRERGLITRRRALSLFLQPEKFQQRFSVASASPKARKILGRVSSSLSRSRRSTGPLHHVAATKTLAVRCKRSRRPKDYGARIGRRTNHLRCLRRGIRRRRVLHKRSLYKAPPVPSGKQQREIVWRHARKGCLSEAPNVTASRCSVPSEASVVPDSTTVWAISRNARTESYLFYEVAHEGCARTPDSPKPKVTLSESFSAFFRAACLPVFLIVVWFVDAIVRLASSCLLFLENQLVSLDIERPDFCVAYVRYILEDEYIVGQPGQHEQYSSSMSVTTPNQQSVARVSTRSTCSQRRGTTALPRFKSHGRLHTFLYTFMVSNAYDVFLVVFNAASLLCLIIEASLTQNAEAGFCFACLECVFVAVFLLESAVRIVVFGFLTGMTKTSALNLWMSLLSTTLLVCNYAWLFSPSLQAAYAHLWSTPAFRAIKLLRSIRAFQLMDALHMSGIRIVASSLASSIGEMKNLAVFLVLVFVTSASTFTQVTQGFKSPIAPNVSSPVIPTDRAPKRSLHTGATILLANNGNNTLDSIIPESVKSSRVLSLVPRVSNFFVSSTSPVADPSDCSAVHAQRFGSIIEAAYTFDSIKESLLGVFVLSTAEGWPLLLAQLLQQQPEEQRTMLVVLVFVFVSLVAIFCVNLFVGIIVEASRRKKVRMEMQGSLLSPAIHKWIEVQKILFDAPLQHGDTVANFDDAGHKGLAWIGKSAAAVVTSPYYRYFDLTQIFLFCFMLLFYGPWYDVLMGNVSTTIDYIFFATSVALSCCFVAGLILKLVARGRFFFRDTLDILDLLICVALVVRLVVAFLIQEQKAHLKLHVLYAFWPVSFRLFRIARFLYRHVSFFRTLFTTITNVAGAFLNALALLSIALFFFALWGVLLFHDSPVKNCTNKYANFTNLPAAIMAVFGACTGEDWHLMLQQMRLYYAQEQKTSLEYFVVFFFVTFIILVFFTLMSLFTSTVLEKYMETVRNESLWKISRQHTRLMEMWTPDENNSHFKTVEDTLEILFSIDFPIGLRNATPPVECPKTAYALLAKYGLPLYDCRKAKSGTNCDHDGITGTGDRDAVYKVHIKDVVLNSARRACKFHAFSNGEGGLQEGSVALDPRLTQSWVTKFSELNRINCVYDLKHFNAAVTIQDNWRLRHISVNSKIASPEWCKRYILNTIRQQMASRAQRLTGRTWRSTQYDGRRESFKSVKRRNRRSSAGTSSYCETLNENDRGSGGNKRSDTTVEHLESWGTTATVFDVSRRSSCSHRRNNSRDMVSEQQHAAHDTSTPQKSSGFFFPENETGCQPVSQKSRPPCHVSCCMSTNRLPANEMPHDTGNASSGSEQAPSRTGGYTRRRTTAGRWHASPAPRPFHESADIRTRRRRASAGARLFVSSSIPHQSYVEKVGGPGRSLRASHGWPLHLEGVCGTSVFVQKQPLRKRNSDLDVDYGDSKNDHVAGRQAICRLSVVDRNGMRCNAFQSPNGVSRTTWCEKNCGSNSDLARNINAARSAECANALCETPPCETLRRVVVHENPKYEAAELPGQVATPTKAEQLVAQSRVLSKSDPVHHWEKTLPDRPARKGSSPAHSKGGPSVGKNC